MDKKHDDVDDKEIFFYLFLMKSRKCNKKTSIVMHFHLKWSRDDKNFIFINFVALALYVDVAYENFSLDKVEIASVDVYFFMLDCRGKGS